MNNFLLAALSVPILAMSAAHADTRNSDKGAAVMEHKASPSNPVKQDEERTEAHSQPDTPHPTASSPRAKSGKKGSASTGSSAPTDKAKPAAKAKPENERAFKALDLDGDGAISKAEAAGNAQLVNAFDRADRDRDGRLSRAEYEMLSKKLAKAR